MRARRLLMWVCAVLCSACGLVTVASAGATELPDGRIYERVSSLAQYGAEVYPLQEITEVSDFFSTDLPFQAAADGNGVAYIGGPSVGGSEIAGYNGGNQYLARRSPGDGWTQSNISPAYYSSAMFQGFSSDLSVGFLDSPEPLTATAPGFGEEIPRLGSYDVLYSTRTSGDEYVPLFTTKPPYREKEQFETSHHSLVDRPSMSGGTAEHRDVNRLLAFAGASSDSSHLLFLANDALTGASEGRPAAEGGPESAFVEEDNLYESVNGQLRLVNILPDGTTHADATFGGSLNASLSNSYNTRFSHVISSDGSRIFWTDLSTGHIYVRENGTTTVEISSAGTYQTASSDGSVVFYTNGDLYEYEVGTGHTSDLTPGVTVEKVIGASEDGQYVYYLTSGGELKLWHDGATVTIGAYTTWMEGEVTPDGHSVVFLAEPNQNALSDALREPIRVYDTDTGELYCASCTGDGTKGVLQETNEANVYRPRWISADGSRVFFITPEALVSQDTNGKFDVYEWERPGAGSCPDTPGSEGCVYLLSGGTSVENSYFADASESGGDVFVVTRAQLVGSDEDELYDLYDVTADGYVPPAPPACTGTGCQGIPGAPPVFATPSSVTFGGVGNFAAPAKKVAAKPKAKKPKAKKHRAKKHRAKKHRAKKKAKKGKSKAKKSARRAVARKRSGAKGGRA